MTSDRARVTYDPSRHYHGVVAQQGRVSLEADWNEAQAIAGAQLAARTLDLVGPAGSPDHGYRITPLPADSTDGHRGDLRIEPGTLYLGGQRLVAAAARYGDQPDWADHEDDPLWRPVAVPEERHELACLLAREQEVGAVEDPVLRDIALGGPDTAQRLRVVQRVIRCPTEATTWEDAWSRHIEEHWMPRGYRLEHGDHRLVPAGRLQVAGHPADGQGQGGYLGPNNQLIRVKVARVDPGGVPVLVWGYDNASFLYRLTSSVRGPATTSIVRLAVPPVDDYHQPAKDQVVEVLRSAALLTGEDYVAAASGQVARVVAYNPDSRELTLAAELPARYLKHPGEGLPLYLRIWQDEVRCPPGEEHELGHTGIRVRLSKPADDARREYPVGAYWMIAIRPGVGLGAPGLVYPQRIVDEPQPPDGPRQWLTPLAFVRWHPDAARAEDCVPRFDRLVREARPGGDHTVTLSPGEVGGGWALQDAIDAHAGPGRAATICLEPGTYVLPRPLRIGRRHGRLTIRAARPGVILRADPESARRFLPGLVIVADAAGVSLTGLELHPAHARFDLDRDAYRGEPERARLLLDDHRGHAVSIGLRAARCAELTVTECRFAFSLPASPERGEGLFGVAIFGSEEVRGLRVAGCAFVSEPISSHPRRHAPGGEASAGRHHLALGFAQVPAALGVAHRADDEDPGHTRTRGSLSIPLLGDAVFEHNHFENLTAPLVAMGQLGVIRLERNTTRDCHAGFWLVTQYASHVLPLLDRLVNQAGDAYRDITKARLTALAEPLVFHATVLARALPADLQLEQEEAAQARALEAPSVTDNQRASELFDQLSAPDAEPPQAPAQRESRSRRFLDRFGRTSRTRDRPAEVAVSPPTTLRARLSIEGNVLDAGGGPGLVVFDTDPDSDASVIVTGNQVRARDRESAAACLYLTRSCAATANVIVNQGPDGEPGPSLVVLAQRHRDRHEAAVTGNVLVGEPFLPRRPDGLPSWESLNSVTRG